MQVFVDPSGSEAQDPEGNAWPNIGTRKTRIKENVPEVKKMGGTTLRQAGKTKRVASGSASAKGSKIVPYRDLGTESGDVPPPAPAAKEGDNMVKAGIVPFRDNDGAMDISSPPKFVPFCDEEVVNTTSTPGPALSSVLDSAMKVKKSVGSKGVNMTEVEALRRDPLKNYGQGDGIY
jgi:spindle assembly checkpoint component MAD3